MHLTDKLLQLHVKEVAQVSYYLKQDENRL